jgi:hypothetical protein
MAINLVTLVMQFLTPDMIGRIAAALGLDRGNVSTAIGAAVPGLLAGLSSTAVQPGGAQKLADAVKKQTGVLDSLANALGSGGQTSLVETGSQMLSSLLGGRDKDALAGTVAKFAGLGQGGGTSLLGMLAPVVLGTIAKQQGARPLDASSIASLLAGQKDNIAAALPAGFGSLLGGTGLLDSLGGAARTATSMAQGTAQATAQAVSDSAQRAAARAPAPSFNRLYWLIPLLAIAALLVYLLNRPTEQVAQQSVTTVPSLTVGGVDIAKQVTDSVSNLRTTLTGIADTASAQSALPKLQDATAQFDKVGGMIGQLSPDQRKVLAGLITPMMPALNQLFDKVLAVPGVSEILKPTIDALKAKLATLTT